MGAKNRNKQTAGTPAAEKTSATVDAVRTPWGVFDATRHDENTRDPFEPDDPILLHSRNDEPDRATGNPAPVTPRELYEMLMTPAAQPSRSSPARSGQIAPLVAAPSTSANARAFPPQADMVLSALEAGQGDNPRKDRRGLTRRTYRVRGLLRLFSDQNNAAPRVLYTRDIHSRGVGFITQHRLPLGYGAEIELPDPKGGTLRVAGTLLRCREAASGWFEGSLYFNREQPRFDEA